MSKKKQKTKNNPKRNISKGKTNKNRNKVNWVLLILILPILVGLFFYNSVNRRTKDTMGPKFQQEGVLNFINPKMDSAVATIAIEIADNDLDRQRGLMWRKTMEEKEGMLFIMEKKEPQTFWMLNTYIALDIIFVDDDYRIVSIQENTKPQSLDPINSNYPAKYVVEVIAGFCKKYKIEVGQSILFESI